MHLSRTLKTRSTQLRPEMASCAARASRRPHPSSARLPSPPQTPPTTHRPGPGNGGIPIGPYQMHVYIHTPLKLMWLWGVYFNIMAAFMRMPASSEALHTVLTHLIENTFCLGPVAHTFHLGPMEHTFQCPRLRRPHMQRRSTFNPCVVFGINKNLLLPCSL